jgi:hypothetical protein
MSHKLKNTLFFVDGISYEDHYIDVTYAGAEVKKYRPNSSTNPVPSIIRLNKINFDVVVTGETVLSGQNKAYTGRKSLTVSNTNINTGGSATLTSQKSITLLPGFIANAGSHVSMYIAFPGCNELSSFEIPPRSDSPVFAKGKSKIKEIELSFEKDILENSISVFPIRQIARLLSY